jgi:hypothetical protein
LGGRGRARRSSGVTQLACALRRVATPVTSAARPFDDAKRAVLRKWGKVVEIAEQASGITVRKSCSLIGFAASLACMWFCLSVIFAVIPPDPSPFVVLLVILLIPAVVVVSALLGVECLWSKVEVDRDRREIRFLVFGRPRTVVPFDRVRTVAAEWDENGLLIPSIVLKGGRVIRFMHIQGGTSRRNAKKIDEAMKAIRQVIGLQNF